MKLQPKPLTTNAAKGRMGLVVVGVVYLLFVIYGSLVPLRFQPMGIDTAFAKFKAIPYLQLGMASRADWVANLLLFVPLAYFWTGAVLPSRGKTLRLMAGMLVCVACVALAFGIEFTQLFFPQRTVSINDIIAESVGGVLGALLWWRTGMRFKCWLESLGMVRGSAGVAERLLWVYLFVLLGYNLLPLDLTLSPVELYHKWHEGRIWVLPFSTGYEDYAHLIYALVSDIAVWAPPALLWKLAYRQSAAKVWLYVVMTATAIELLQLFVYSRTTDTTDILTAALGGTFGLLLARRQTPRAAAKINSSVVMLKVWLGLGIWLAVLAAVFWYPFDFNFDRAFVRERLLTLHRVPFSAYYFGTEFRAITEVLHKTGFMLPLGIFLGMLSNASALNLPRKAWHTLCLLMVVTVAFGIEFGQLFLPDKIVDLTDLVLEVLGGAVGYFGYLWSMALVHPASQAYRR